LDTNGPCSGLAVGDKPRPLSQHIDWEPHLEQGAHW
jgi:hypothetical protein